ncbi:MAG: BON domain-containing protein [Leptothrix sp. (in: b-proteobacteria)]
MSRFSGSTLLASVRALTVVAGALTAMSGLVVASHAQAAGTVDDTSLAAQVKETLSHDDNLQAQDIKVVAQAGRVHLSGWVTDPADVQEAMHDAMKVPGVTSVDSNLHTWASK